MIRISSSQAAACLGISKYKTQQALQLELLGKGDAFPQPDERDVNNPLVFGHLVEAVVLEAGRRLLEQWLLDREEADALPVSVVHLGGDTGRDTGWEHSVLPMKGHPDGVYQDARGRLYLTDAKSTQIWDGFDPDTDDVPDDVFCQILHMWELARDHYGMQGQDVVPIVPIPVMRRGHKRAPFVLVMVPIQQELLEQLIAAEQRFIRDYATPDEHGNVPVAPGANAAEVAAELASVELDETPGYVDDALAERFEEYFTLKGRAAFYTGEADAMRLELLESFGACKYLRTMGGIPVAQVSVSEAERIDVERLRAEAPDIAARFTKRSPTVAIRRWAGPKKGKQARVKVALALPEEGDV